VSLVQEELFPFPGQSLSIPLTFIVKFFGMGFERRLVLKQM
jgi:hypothetical protein